MPTYKTYYLRNWVKNVREITLEIPFSMIILISYKIFNLIRNIFYETKETYTPSEMS